MHGKEGRSIRQTGRLLNRPYSTVRRWLLHAVESGGMSGRHDAAPPGAPCRRDASQLRELRADLVAGPRRCGLESGARAAPLVVRHVQDRFGVRHGDRGMYDLLVRPGFPRGKPGPGHPKPASESAKAGFKKKRRAPPGGTPSSPGRVLPHNRAGRQERLVPEGQGGRHAGQPLQGKVLPVRGAIRELVRLQVLRRGKR